MSRIGLRYAGDDDDIFTVGLKSETPCNWLKNTAVYIYYDDTNNDLI